MNIFPPHPSPARNYCRNYPGHITVRALRDTRISNGYRCLLYFSWNLFVRVQRTLELELGGNTTRRLHVPLGVVSSDTHEVTSKYRRTSFGVQVYVRMHETSIVDALCLDFFVCVQSLLFRCIILSRCFSLTDQSRIGQEDVGFYWIFHEDPTLERRKKWLSHTPLSN